MRKIISSRGNWWTPPSYELPLYYTKPFHCNLTNEMKLLCLSGLRHFRYTFLDRFERKNKNSTSTLSKESSMFKVHENTYIFEFAKFNENIRTLHSLDTYKIFDIVFSSHPIYFARAIRQKESTLLVDPIYRSFEWTEDRRSRTK